ncbi:MULTISPECIES: ABC transporter ATP-binding protein [Desulfosediminicola]|uniref:ABC transporter ATP-binding protein n=1 Tax=Desulfosediminicola TaxID=2886823 RepID=UPI0010AD87F3|nr:ABC transporter ATP-binding protein [Desulfosediminicola ganghwensis]
MTIPKIKIDNVSQIYNKNGTAFVVLDNFNLEIAQNEFVTVVGTSGCGKSTLLNIVGGLVDPTEGQVQIDGMPISGPGRDRGFVFQSYSLFEWLTVTDNILFALKGTDMGESEKRELVQHYIESVGLVGFEKAYPNELSGGMKQRVAIARALVYKPSVLLMDEPFGALDSQTRGMMQELLLKVWGEHKTTVLFITHDVDEAIFLSDRVIVMSSRPGRLKQDKRIGISRPRSYEIMTEPLFMEAKKGLIESIREETLKTMGTVG